MPSELVAQVLRKPYARVIIPDDTGRYAAQVLEFPGCLSEGATPDEAYRNLQEATRNWVDAALSQGMAIPEPFAAQGYSGTVSLRLPKSIHKRAAQYARRDGVSLNQFLVSAIATRVGAEDQFGAIASRLDDRLNRLQATEWVPVEGVLRRIPVATTPGRQTSTDIQFYEHGESAPLSPVRRLLSAREVLHG